MYIHFKISGVLLIILALSHVIFPKYFNWKDDLKSLSLVNRQVMIIHTFFIALIVFLMGLLCLTSTIDLIETTLGKTLSLGLGVFWSIRLFIQFFGYSKALWKGKRFETIIHILFSGLWGYLSILFWMNYLTP
ncbi:hypothetical protein N9611_01000 [Flavobacteriaceae bacterium]|nr:hypothetical protein [Flavobacteriaceae bacterium]